MALKELKVGEVDTSIIYVPIKQLMAETGVSKSSIHLHIKQDYIDAYVFKNKVFFTPEQAQTYKGLVDCGLLGGDR